MSEMNINNKKTILVVEDNRLNMKLAVDLLELNGFDVLKAIDGETALTILEKQIPDLILLDIQLPGMDGFEILKIIRKEARLNSVKAVAFTASVMKEAVEHIRASGFDGYIAKPFDTKNFITKVKKTLLS